MRNSLDWFDTCKAVMAAGVLTTVAVAVPSGQGPAVLSVSGRSSATPSIAAIGRFVAVAWGGTATGGGSDIFVAVSRDAGVTFGPPSRANDAATPASLSGEQPPRVTLLPSAGRDPSVLVVWSASGTAGTLLLSARSEDGGRSFTRPASVAGSWAPGNRGWEATAAHPDGHAVAIWLDHRDLASANAGTKPSQTEQGEHQHAGPMAQQTDGVARAQLSKLFFARLDHEGSARAITGGVCYCCKTAVATGADGAIYAAWRHVYPGNVRDIAFTVSRDGGLTFAAPVRVSEDEWVLDGCPENGPALTVDDAGLVHIVWPTLVPDSTSGEPTLGLFYSSALDGRRFAPRQRIPTEGVPRHPQIAFIPGAVVLAWDEQVDGTRRLAAAIGRRANQTGMRFVRVPISDRERGEYPAVAGTAEGFLAVWTSGTPTRSAIGVQRIGLP